MLRKRKNEGRPPIVAVLGHVDHGKTSLISKIYEKDLTKKEFGGISQHIGAYQVKLKTQNSKLKTVTFIDTPGHVAFSKMRSRGAKVADLAVLVVAADEGVKPQTLESLKHIQKANIPFLVAINKVDLPGINLDWVKKNLAENNILVEGYGGNIVAVPVSAKTGKGVDHLLEMILLLGEMAELKAEPAGKLKAVVIESKLDKRRGPEVSILVRNGSLRLGEEIVAEGISAKIKVMVNDRGQNVQTAVPSQPVEVLGFTAVLPVGAKVEEKLPSVMGVCRVIPVKVKKTVPAVGSPEDDKKLKIIVKADVVGTLEAILGSLPGEVRVLFSKVGDINESDVLLASTTKAEIIGFNVKVGEAIKKLAQSEGVVIKTYQIIYELLEDIEKRVLKMIEPTIDEEFSGQAEIIAEFIVKKQRVAGCKVQEGEIDKKLPLHLKRGEKIIGDCQIMSMKTGKQDIEKAKKSEEFGAILSGQVDFKIGDMLISFRKVTKENE